MVWCDALRGMAKQIITYEQGSDRVNTKTALGVSSHYQGMALETLYPDLNFSDSLKFKY